MLRSNMDRVAIRALKQNASAVVARAAAGETLVITDRGRPVAQLATLAEGGLARLRMAGLTRPPRRGLSDLPPPVPAAESLSGLVIAARDAERA